MPPRGAGPRGALAAACTAAAAIAITTAAAQEPSSPAILTLEAAVSEALRNAADVRVAELQVRGAENDLAAARTNRLPSFDGSLLGGELLHDLEFRYEKGAFGTFPGIGPIPDADTKLTTERTFTTIFSASATQPLSQLYRIGQGIQVKSVEREIAGEDLRLARQSVINETRRSYYQALQLQSGLSASEEAIRLYEELERVVSENVAQQTALTSDALEVKARLARQRYEALKLRNGLESTKESINRLMGRDLGTPFALEEAPEAEDAGADLAQARSRALSQRPEIREARLKAEQAGAAARMKRSEYFPDVSLSLRYVRLGNFDQVVPENFSSIGVFASWEPFDWGRRSRELAQKQVAQEQAGVMAKDAEQMILLEVNARHRELTASRALLEAARVAEEAAREKLRVTSGRYAQQAALLKDVLQDQTSLSQATHDYQQALLSFWTARADFEKALGED